MISRTRGPWNKLVDERPICGSPKAQLWNFCRIWDLRAGVTAQSSLILSSQFHR